MRFSAAGLVASLGEATRPAEVIVADQPDRERAQMGAINVGPMLRVPASCRSINVPPSRSHETPPSPPSHRIVIAPRRKLPVIRREPRRAWRTN